MSKAKTALSKKTTISHGLELYEYFLTRNIRKKINIYNFENSFISKYKTYKDFKLLEKDFKDEKSLEKNKKVLKLL